MSSNKTIDVWPVDKVQHTHNIERKGGMKRGREMCQMCCYFLNMSYAGIIRSMCGPDPDVLTDRNRVFQTLCMEQHVILTPPAVDDVDCAYHVHFKYK